MTYYREQAIQNYEKSQNKFVAIVTGGNAGIGLQTCLHLLRAHYKLIIACRNAKTSKNAIKYLTEKSKELDLPVPDILALHLDLTSLGNVKEFCEQIKKLNLPVNLIINNAGVMFVPKSLTKDGYESHFGVNHLGHFYLNMLLLPILLKNAPSRIVILTSGTYSYGSLNLNVINSEKYHRWWAYCNSKLCNIYYGLTLHRKLKEANLDKKILIFIVHPGSVKTDIVRYSGSLLNKIYSVKLFNQLIYLRTPYDGCSGTVYAALSKDVPQLTGHYFHTTFPLKLKSAALDKEKIQEELWSFSEIATKTSFHSIIRSTLHNQEYS